MKIELRQDGQAHLIDPSDEEIDVIAQYLRFPDPTAYWTGAPSHVSFFKLWALAFSAGFVPIVVAELERRFGVVPEVVDLRQLCPRDPVPDLGWLYDFQREALTTALEAVRGVIWIPMGGGKGEIIAAAARVIPGRWLAIVPMELVARQTAARYDELQQLHGLDHGPAGFIGGGEWAEGARLTCATFQTLARRLKAGDTRAVQLLDRVDGLIVDECHTLPASSFLRVAKACKAQYRIGLSGTPLSRSDMRSVFAIEHLGPIIYRVRAEELIQQRVIAAPTVRMLLCLQGEVGALEDWRSAYESRIVRSARRNGLAVEIMRAMARPGIVFVREKLHGRQLEKLGWRAGIRSKFLSADNKRSITQAVKELKRGALDLLISTSVLDTGVSIPELRSVLHAGGGESGREALQKLGRGARVERDATGEARADSLTFQVWDFLDSGPKWLAKHAKARKRAYEEEGYTVTEITEIPTGAS